MPIRFLIGFVVLTALSSLGCERPGLEDSRGAVIGTWAQDRRMVRTSLTVEGQHTLLDPMDPGRGEIRLEGAVSATLLFMRTGVDPFGGGRPLLVSEAPIFEFAFAPSLNGETVVLELPRNEDKPAAIYAGRRRYVATQDTDVFVNRAAPEVRVRSGVFVEAGIGSDTIYVEGALRGATMTLPSNESIRVSTLTTEWPEDERTTYTFRPDSTLLISAAPGDTARHRWELQGEELVLILGPGADNTYRFAYRRQGGNMQLNIDFDCDGADQERCVGRPARGFDVREEALVDVQQRMELHFVRQSPSSRRIRP